jgi:Caspase domain
MYDEYSTHSHPHFVLSVDDNSCWSNDTLSTLQTLIPVDFKRAGQIVDDDIYKHLVKRVKAGVTVTVLMDCCHSGTTWHGIALNLPSF